ncbi:hypothetical protein Salat_0185300 [Sesamum alatum]|uniref:Uncharacterized protein n=1 Tax=Sesamum alatum TaxID=300844 RepID=A0AAE1YXC4_9LAMI|nr:hypothetical protein Salat_0185300 [Sesamum alatum]
MPRIIEKSPPEEKIQGKTWYQIYPKDHDSENPVNESQEGSCLRYFRRGANRKPQTRSTTKRTRTEASKGYPRLIKCSRWTQLKQDDSNQDPYMNPGNPGYCLECCKEDTLRGE